jgi:hypothetical protein
MLDALTAEQVLEWEAYNELEPIGEYRRDYMQGQLLALVSNLATALYGPKNSTKPPAEPEDFIPWLEHTPKSDPSIARTPEEMKNLFQMLAKQQKERKAEVDALAEVQVESNPEIDTIEKEHING